MLDTYLKETNNKDVLDDAVRIYNSDETGFCLTPKSGKVIAMKTDNLMRI